MTATDSLRLAVGTLTAVRVPPPEKVTSEVAGHAMLLAPLVGLVPGGLGGAALWLGTTVGWSDAVAAAVAVAVLAVSTRGLHLDGLADTADGLAASYDPQRSLAVMRRSDIGPAGVAAVVLVLLVQTLALAEAVTVLGPVAVVVAAMAGRTALPLACRRGVPAARGEGLGALVAGTVGASSAIAVLAVVVAAAAMAGLAGDVWAWTGGCVLASAAMAYVVVRRASRRFGGITGDVLGACVELGTAAALLVLACP